MMRDVRTVIENRGRGGHFWLGHDIGNFVSKSLVLKASVDNETRNAIKTYEKSLGVMISYWDFSGKIAPLVLPNDKDGYIFDILLWNDPIASEDEGGCGAECFKTESEMFTNFRTVLQELDRIFATSLTELRMRLMLMGVKPE